ncbi:MAG: 16S rRNA (guanine(966)-N(2))-methyltransferase RsmD [Hyphomicrobiaceae bacterium]|nr:16S rRNA (guanine(966)-N(2))-methyltransferase RsmD [Hyphomicrobiaceae bacterium]MCC0023004.1 16S rRNA (guanine(966)-N(2))-methyltransferase RsmD [Hyphomicrobiaceae bacterium]
MRIVAGRFRGKQLNSPKDQSIRPTSDRVRESVFNIVASRVGPSFEGLYVLDLFAGTGAMGLEALSRGATHTIFVDMGAEARGLIRGHIEGFGLGGQSRLLRRDATDMGPAGNQKPADLVFCDPPYGKGLGEKALLSALAGGWIALGALIVLEERKGAVFNPGDDFEIIDQRDYGDTTIFLIQPSSRVSA